MNILASVCMYNREVRIVKRIGNMASFVSTDIQTIHGVDENTGVGEFQTVCGKERFFISKWGCDYYNKFNKEGIA
jgi:hypothetical protein